MEDEQIDTCRICSGPAEPNVPLFYPCKCSGTIRYIHQDCLTTWLEHSKKRTCDVCKYPYSFTKVYDPKMPQRIPALLFVRGIFNQIITVILLVIRAIWVAIVWLLALPYATICMWRFYFWTGDVFTSWIRDQSLRFTNSTTPEPSPPPLTPLADFQQTLYNFLSDVFSGQIISALIVIVFLAGFVLREWIVQNARPGVFGDADAVVDVAEDQPPQAAAAPPPQAPRVLPRAGENAIDEPALIDLRSRRVHKLQRPPVSNRSLMPMKRMRMSSDDESSTYSSDSSDHVDSEHMTAFVKHAERSYNNGGESSSASAAMNFREPSGSGLKGKSVARSQRQRRIHSHGLRSKPEDRKVPIDDVESDAIRESLPTTLSRMPSSRPVEDVSATADNEDKYLKSAFPGSSDSAVSSDFQFTFEATPLPSSSWVLPSTSPTGFSSSPFTSSASSSFASVGTNTMPEPTSEHPEERGRFPPPSNFDFGGSSSSRTVHPFEQSPYPPLEPISSARTRRPPLPPTTPTSELPPPSPRPPHAIPVSSQTPSGLRSVTMNGATYTRPAVNHSTPSPGLATYRAPEELSDPEYFGHQSVPPVRTPVIGSSAAGGADVKGKGREVEEPETRADPGPANEVGNVPPPVQAPNVDGAAAEGGAPADGAEAGEDAAAEVGEDDMDGALEAIGMRGPLRMVLQNVGLVVLILDLTIGVAVWFPFVIGKAVALLALNPRRLVTIIHFPIRVVRLITDPIVDLVVAFARAAVARLFAVVRPDQPSPTSKVWSAVGSPMLRWFQNPEFSEVEVKAPNSNTFFKDLWRSALNKLNQFKATPPPAPTSAQDRILAQLSHIVRYAEEHVSSLRQSTQEFLASFREQFELLTIGNGPRERVFAVILGYIAFVICAAVYVNNAEPRGLKGIAGIIRTTIIQQVIVLKVAIFIFIELAIFPFGCGVTLAFFTLPIFPDSSVWTRLDFYRNSPFTCTFIHWMLGTIFMYEFATLLAACRGVMRPGAMWFIKDPQDPQFHPIRDILDRPAFSQMRKLLVSAVMYFCVIAGGIGSAVFFVRYAGEFVGLQLLPLRWNLRDPLSEIPVDLLFLQIVVPPTLPHFQPGTFLLSMVARLWLVLARRLRLTSYMFGERRAEEESSTPWPWSDSTVRTRDGVFARAPAGDNIVFTQDKHVLVTTTEQGDPISEAGKALVEAQDAVARKAGRDPKDDYTIIYLPPHFSRRVLTFIFLLWLVGVSFAALAIGAPILTGRAIFAMTMPKQIHDGYSFIAGFYVLWGAFLIPPTVIPWYRHQRIIAAIDRSSYPLKVAIRSVSWIFQITWLAISLGFIIPLLLAIVLELYIIFPLRAGIFPSDTVPTIRLWEDWALGLIVTKIALKLQRLQPPGKYMRAIDTIIQNGVGRPNALAATRDFIAPVGGGMLAMILFPAAVLYAFKTFSPWPLGDQALIRHVYPAIFILATLLNATISLQNVMSSWVQVIRDKEFLVEVKLKNLEETPKPKDKIEAED